MGCFDYTYADNGRNTRGCSGYLYLTKAFCEKTGLKSPVHYESMDEYGMITIKCKGKSNHITSYLITLDIHAIHAAMLYLTGVLDKNAKDFEDYMNYIQLLVKDHVNIRKKPLLWTTIESLEDKLRTDSIHYFFDVHKDYTTTPLPVFHMQKLGNQPEKDITCKTCFTGRLPILISKKKLPQEQSNDLFEIANRWGFVSTNDPNQGFSNTKNLWVRFAPVEKELTQTEKDAKAQALIDQFQTTIDDIIKTVE